MKFIASQIFLALITFSVSASASDNPFDFSDFNKLAKNGLGWDVGFNLKGAFTDDFEDARSNPRLRAVTSEFGPTIINLRDLPIRSEVASAEREAWSSWWFPKFETLLFQANNGEYSPLEKYDSLRGRGSQAAKWEEENEYNPTAARWEGLCDAWSLAAITYPEPKRPVKIRNVNFNVGDLKALVLKTYENVDDRALKIYGVRFEGNRNSWVFPDIFPDQLHRFVEIQLFKNKKSFIMDHDPGVAVWTVPVFKANYTIEQDRSDPNQVIVKMWLYNAAQLTSNTERDLVGTRQETREFNYVLRGERNSQGQLVINAGAWSKGAFTDSRDNHPDYLVTVPNTSALYRQSKNTHIDGSFVDTIVRDSL
jgi:hypothetical protein